MKAYNDCNKVERHIIIEYAEWSICENNALALIECSRLRERAKNLNIEHLLYSRRVSCITY